MKELLEDEVLLVLAINAGCLIVGLGILWVLVIFEEGRRARAARARRLREELWRRRMQNERERARRGGWR